MIISTDIKNPLNNLLSIINNYSNEVQSIATVHGSSSQLNQVFYVSDIDLEYWMRYQNNKEVLFNHFNEILNLLLKNKMYFTDLIAGTDDRFVFNYKIRKNGQIINYNPLEIKNKLKDVIGKKDYKNLTSNLVDNITLIQLKEFEIAMLPYKKIHWNLEEIKKGEKVHHKKTFKLYDLFMTDNFTAQLIFEYLSGKYISVELVFHVFSLPDKFISLNPPFKMTTYDFIIQNSKIYGDVRGSTQFYYDTIFKNYTLGNYLKVLKRIRSLLGEVYFKSKNINIENHNLNKKMKEPQYKNLIRDVRKEINNVVKSHEISCINQLNGRIDVIIGLMNYKEELEIKRLIIELLKDAKDTCKYPDNVDKIYHILQDYNKYKMIVEMKEYKKAISQKLNVSGLYYLKIFYNKLKVILPFTLNLP